MTPKLFSQKQQCSSTTRVPRRTFICMNGCRQLPSAQLGFHAMYLSHQFSVTATNSQYLVQVIFILLLECNVCSIII